MDPLLAADQPLALAAALLAIVALAILAERHTRLGRLLSAPAVILIAGAAASNLRLIPLEATLYGGIFQYLLPVAIPLLLLKADLRRVLTGTGSMAVIFIVAAVFAVLGTLLAVLLVDLGPEEHKLAGTLAATFTGGSMNFVAVSSALQFDDASLVATALAADNVLGAAYLALLAMLSGTAFFQRRVRSRVPVTSGVAPSASVPEPRNLLADLAVALALSVFIVALASGLAAWLGIAHYAILLVTLLAVVVANVAPRRLQAVRGDAELGMLLMFVFFAVIGASTDLHVFIRSAPSVAFFVAIILITHVVLIFGMAYLLRLDFAEIAVASNACIAGPATAAALAATRGWPHLVSPGLLCGVLGYVIANFIGITLAALLGP